MNGPRRTAAVVLLAALGIALAAAITYGTSQLVRQHIGLAGEPLTAGSRLLAPARARPTPAPNPPAGTRVRSTPSRTTPAAPAPVAPAQTTPPSQAETPPTLPSTPATAPEPSAPARSGGEGDHARAGDD